MLISQDYKFFYNHKCLQKTKPLIFIELLLEFIFLFVFLYIKYEYQGYTWKETLPKFQKYKDSWLKTFFLSSVLLT